MLLLIFFLLTSQFVIQTGVKVKLPGSKTNEQTVPSRLIVSITQKGEIFIGQKKIPLDNLAFEINSRRRTSSDDNLSIRADKTVPIDLIIKVIDAAKSAGVDKFTIETEKESL
jgi:biopolymer transport protein ExbD